MGYEKALADIYYNVDISSLGGLDISILRIIFYYHKSPSSLGKIIIHITSVVTAV